MTRSPRSVTEAVAFRGEVDAEVARVTRRLKAERDADREQIAELRRLLDFTQAIDEARVRPAAWKQPAHAKPNHGIATVMLTDTHFDEMVDPAQVDFYNSYDRTIGELRLRKWADSIVKLTRDDIANTTWDGCVVLVGGDIFSGNIHEELRETNVGTLFEAVVHWLEPMLSAFRLLGDTFGHVELDCVVGNHGRMTRKPRAKKRAQDNVEWLMYRIIERELRGDERFTVHVADGADLRVGIYNCVSPDTRVLTWDMRWVRAGDLAAGDALLGFDEDIAAEGSGRGRTRRWRKATVLHTSITPREVVRITLADGRSLVCTPDHKWLCGTSYGFANQWVEARAIRPGWTLREWFRPWDTNTTAEAGWLAGIMDGEGSLGVRSGKGSLSSPDGRAAIQPSIAQLEGIVSERIRDTLASLGIQYHEAASKKTGVIAFTLRGGLAEYVRVLGTIRPSRLLAEFQAFMSNLAPHMNATGGAKVVSVERIGRKPVVVMGTDTETYIAEGFGSHNTRYLLTHGDAFRGGTGISAALAPLMIGRSRKERRELAAGAPFDWLVCGHWHQLWMGKGVIVGGTLKGIDEYAWQGSFEPEPPSQAFWVTDPRHGVTLTAPIHVMDRASEGW